VVELVHELHHAKLVVRYEGMAVLMVRNGRYVHTQLMCTNTSLSQPRESLFRVVVVILELS